MFPSSTQKKNWMFRTPNQIFDLRKEANKNFISRYGNRNNLQNVTERQYLTVEEENSLLRFYEQQLQDFCIKFEPPMPHCVIGTAHNYFKRFYLYNSPMDYHPKEILVTCVYLACKVEEFNISITQFVGNVKGDREKATDVILNNELLLMQQLKYHLLVHNPIRPVEGLLIDIKTRCKMLKDAEQLRFGIEEFLKKSFITNCCLLYAPSQIALAAVLQSASKNKENLDAYVTEALLGETGKPKLPNLIGIVRNIRQMVKTVDVPSRDIIKQLERKLEMCRNQSNNPDSQAYQHRMQDIEDEEGQRQMEKYSRIAEERQKMEEMLLGGGTAKLASSSPENLADPFQ